MKIFSNKKLFNEENIFAYLTGLIFLSLYFVSSKFVFDIGVKITIADIAILGIFIFFLYRFFKKYNGLRIQIPIILLIVFIIFILIVGLDIKRVKWPLRNFTLFIMCLRNIFIMIAVSSFKLKENKILKTIANISIFVSTVSLIMYFLFLIKYQIILSNQSLWRPGIWYYLGEGSILRLSGVGNDPNFFGIVNIIGLIFCLFLFNERKYKIGAIVIFLSIVLTFSRTLFIILVILILIFTVLSLILKKCDILKEANVNYLKICLVFILFGILISLFMPSINIIGMMQEKMKSGIENGFADRFHLWSLALSSFRISPLIGQGGRYIQMTVGRYIHNDYLEILSSYGLLGFFIVMFFLLGNLKIGILNLTNNIKIGAYILLIVYMIFMMGFSIFFNPYIYFIIGLLWGNSYKDEYLEVEDGKFYGK
jgi:O-antigen ligase